MSKRSLKKQQKRQAAVLEQLEELDRTLRQSLANGDLGRIESLLHALRRSGGGSRPLAVLAAAVLDLAGGRCAAARSRLAALPGLEGAAEALPEGLLPNLAELARDGLPNEIALSFCRALQSLDREALAGSLQALRATAPAEAHDLHRFLDTADRSLSLLTALAALPAESRIVIDWLRGSAPRLAAALAGSGSRLLAPLQHAVRMSWRTVLTGIQEKEGSPGLEALYAAEPKLLAVDVDLPGGAPGGAAAVRQRMQAQQLLATSRYAELTRLLRERSRTVTDTSSLAALWGLELCVRSRLVKIEGEEGEEEDGFDPSPPRLHAIVIRLLEMAGEIGRRFPAAQRSEMARVLRDELFDLCEAAYFCEHTTAAAVLLLAHQPGDLGLLIAGVAGAVAGRDHRSLRALRDLLTASQVQLDLAVAKRLMVQVARELPATIAETLGLLKPLFPGGAWPEIRSLVAKELAAKFALFLTEESLDPFADAGQETTDLSFIRSQLDLLRPELGETEGFAGVELAIDCWRPERPAVERRIKKFLADRPGLDGALTAFRLLEMAAGPWAPKGADTACHTLANAVIDRLDDDWQHWHNEAPLLAVAADDGHRKSLAYKLRMLLNSSELPAEGRETLNEVLHAIESIQAMEKLLLEPKRRRGPRSGRPRKPRRKRAGAPQLRLDLP